MVTIKGLYNLYQKVEPTNRKVLGMTRGEKNDGLTRWPTAHTCGSVMELPSTYNTFPELQEEFNNILAKTSGKMR